MVLGITTPLSIYILTGIFWWHKEVTLLVHILDTELTISVWSEHTLSFFEILSLEIFISAEILRNTYLMWYISPTPVWSHR